MQLQTGLLELWMMADTVARAVLLALLAMSVASWSTIVIKTMQFLRMRRNARAVDRFWQAADPEQGIARMGRGGTSNPFRQLALAASDAAAHHHAAAASGRARVDISDWLTRALADSIDHTNNRTQTGLPLLASVGSTAPYVGLLGTVWGIHHALAGISQAGSGATIDQVAGPIGEALIMTALGLAVALPAVLGYNALVRSQRELAARLRRFAAGLHALHVTGARLPAAGGAGAGFARTTEAMAEPLSPAPQPQYGGMRGPQAAMEAQHSSAPRPSIASMAPIPGVSPPTGPGVAGAMR